MKQHLFSLLFLSSSSLLVLLAQPAFAQITQITGVKYKLAERGLEIILVTPNSKNLLSFPKKKGNTQIFDISEAKLSLPCGKVFRREHPVPGIQSIDVSSQDGDRLSVAVTGEASIPKVTVLVTSRPVDCIRCNFHYPEELRRRHIEGSAKVILDIDKIGNVTKASLNSSSGNTELDNTILKQATEMKFVANACGQNVMLRANFIIQGSEFHRQAIEEYKVRSRQEALWQQLRDKGDLDRAGSSGSKQVWR